MAVNIDSSDINITSPGLPANAKRVARNFRYMRRKPTIMAYQPPKGKMMLLVLIRVKKILLIIRTSLKSSNETSNLTSS